MSNLKGGGSGVGQRLVKCVRGNHRDEFRICSWGGGHRNESFSLTAASCANQKHVGKMQESIEKAAKRGTGVSGSKRN